MPLPRSTNSPESHSAYAVRTVRALWRLATDGAYRGVWWLKLRGRDAFQPFNDTAENRYPRIFAFVQSELGRDCAGRILSFGCSTGEEVFSLRRYFPRAIIKGVDINDGNIAACRARLARTGDPGILFEVASSTEREATASYDAVFCMAVLRHGGLTARIARCDHLMRFEDFARAVEDLARCVRPGGLLAIRHSNFRFCDAPTSRMYEPVFGVPDPYRTPIYGPDNTLMEGVFYADTVFRKARQA